MPRKKKQPNDLKEGQYPSVVVAQSAAGAPQRIPITKEVPKAERPVAPIKDALLSSFLLATFEDMNIKGKSGLDALILLCRMGAWRYDTLKRFCVAWEDLHQQNLFREFYPEGEFKEPTLEQCCDYGKVGYDDFIGDVTKMIYHYGLETAKWQIHVGLGEVVQASRDTAKMIGKEGFNDRQLLLRAGHLIEEGPGTVVNVNNQVTTNQVVGLPKWEETDKVLVEALRPAKQLAEASTVDAEIIEAAPMEKENAP